MHSIEMRYPLAIGETLDIDYYGDVHLDSLSCDLERFHEDMAESKDRGSRVFLGGDLFSAITKNDKRYRASGSRFSDVDAQFTSISAFARKQLEPYVDQIDYMMYGNHETSAIQWSSVDLIAELWCWMNEKRSKDLPRIRRGGYSGFIQLVFERGKDGGYPSKKYVIFTSHSRGSAKKSKGMLDFHSYYEHYPDADMIWLQHKHSRITDSEEVLRIDRNGNIYSNLKKGIQSGTYQKSFREVDLDGFGPDGEPLAYKSDYGEESHSNNLSTTGCVTQRFCFHGENTDLKEKILI